MGSSLMRLLKFVGPILDMKIKNSVNNTVKVTHWNKLPIADVVLLFDSRPRRRVALRDLIL